MSVFYYNKTMKLWNQVLEWTSILILLVALGTGFYFLFRWESNYFLSIFICIYSINIILSTIIFMQKRQKIGKLSWMMFFIIFPIIAHVAFILYGQRYKYRKSINQYFQKDNFKYELENQKSLKFKNEDIFHNISSTTKRGIYKADIDFIDKGDEGYEKLFHDLRNAKKFIHLQYYIIKPGEIYEELKHILIKKASEKIEIRLIVDDFGRWAMPWHEIKFLEEKGIKIEKFGKIRFPFLTSYNTYRMHRKVAIIDGEIVHTGGINIADEYSNINKKYGLWIDFQTRIMGPGVRTYNLLFLDDWNSISTEKLDMKKYMNNISKSQNNFKNIMTVVEDSPEILEPILQDTIVKLITNSKKSIKIVTPYFVPTPEIFSALRYACLSGIDVRIIIPGKPDKKAAIIATRYFSKELMKYGAKIYEAQNILIHSKIGLFDDEFAYTGTANLDTRSLFGQWEFINIIEGDVIPKIKNTFDDYFKLSNQLEYKKLYKGFLRDILIRFYVNLFSPII